MKIHILSDLHIEFGDFSIPQTDADVLVLAGDIGVGLGGLEWLHAQNIQKPVIYVPGNHEYYHHDICLIDTMREYAAANIHVLDNNKIVINGVRFLGSTLWTDFDCFGEADRFFAIQNARENMTDFSVIMDNGKLFSPEASIRLHQKSRGWLECALGEPYRGKTVVVTHHAPSSGSVHSRFASSLLTPAFTSYLEYMMDKDRVELWIHGHMHDVFDYDVYGTRVICNPRGYIPFETSEGFNSGLVVEV